MIKIKSNSLHSIEKQYICDFIFNTVLQTEYKFEVDENLSSILININNQNYIQVKTAYFSLKRIIGKDALPCGIKFFSPDDTEKRIPVFYGEPHIESIEQKEIIHFDLFGMIFFMLTRWEEYILSDRDQHGRFPAHASFSYKNNFINRPIVNELINLLKIMIESKGYKLPNTKGYQTFISHDIDHLYYPASPKKFIGDLVKRKSFNAFKNRVKYKFNSPYNNFEWLIKCSSEHNLTSHFYFMGSSPSPINNDYLFTCSEIKKAVSLIKESDHIIGIHPSYDTPDNLKMLKNEKYLLEENVGTEIIEGRQHYLRFNTPTTWNNWDESGLETDSTLGYPEVPGFRCGTGHEFNVFDFLNRKTLKLKERPLIFMDTTAKYYQNLTNEQTYNSIMNLKDMCKKNATPLTLLFHNSSFEEIEWKGYKDLYQEILVNIK